MIFHSVARVIKYFEDENLTMITPASVCHRIKSLVFSTEKALNEPLQMLPPHATFFFIAAKMASLRSLILSGLCI